MNASKRWTYHFIGALECVRCRRKGDLTLRHFNGKRVEVEDLTIEEVRATIPTMDVWCSQCPPKITTRVAGPGRLIAKQEAATIADVRVGTVLASHYDEYVIAKGQQISKRDLFSALKRQPCMSCRRRYPEYLMGILNGTRVSTFSNVYGTMHDIIKRLTGGYVLCQNCMMMILNDDKEEPTTSLTFDENFWSSVFTL